MSLEIFFYDCRAQICTSLCKFYVNNVLSFNCFLLLQDNAIFDRTCFSQASVVECGFTEPSYSRYWPYLSASEFQFCHAMKKQLRGHHWTSGIDSRTSRGHTSDSEDIMEDIRWSVVQDKSLYKMTVSKLQNRNQSVHFIIGNKFIIN